MANTDNARGFMVEKASEAPVLMVCKTGETVAVGDAVILDGSNGVTIATATSTEIYGVIVPQVNASGVMKGLGENLFTTSTAGQTVWVQLKHPDTTFLVQDAGTPVNLDVGVTYDIAGSTGVFESNTGAGTYGVIRVKRVIGTEICRYHNNLNTLASANGILEVTFSEGVL